MKLRRFTTAFVQLVPFAATFSLPEVQSVFANPFTASSILEAPHQIPTVHESAVQARRILHLESIGTLSTIFPSPSSHSSISSAENRPNNVGGTPIGLMDYIADCEPSTGNPTILAISIATSFKNVAAGSNITLSLRWHPPDEHKRRYSAANLPRFSLIGYLEDMTTEDVQEHNIAQCFTKHHPDARAWLPGNRIHASHWTRLVVQEVYWVGGFGDRAYIGWIPTEDWRNVTRTEVAQCRLPGEQDTVTLRNRLW